MTGFFQGLNVRNNKTTLLVVRLPRLFLCRTSLDYIFFLLCGNRDCTQREIVIDTGSLICLSYKIQQKQQRNT